MMQKRGELTSSQIIIIVLAVAGFLVLATFLAILNITKETDKEACHLSVLARAVTPSLAQSKVPLKCVAEKICLIDTENKAQKPTNCVDVFGDKKEVKIIRVKGSEEEKAEQIDAVNAEAMYSCWKMMGEGKLDIFGDLGTWTGYSAVTSSCVICSRVMLDKSINNPVIEKLDFNNYLAKTQVPGSTLTYLQAFSDKGVQSYPKVDDSVYSKFYSEAAGKESDYGESVTGGEITSALERYKDENINRQMAYIFMQIRPRAEFDVIKNQIILLGVVGGVGMTSAPTRAGAVFVLKRISAAGLGWYAAAAAAIAAAASFGVGAYNADKGQNVAGVYCGEFNSASSRDEEDTKGCSIVRGINYDYETINQFCQKIEGSA